MSASLFNDLRSGIILYLLLLVGAVLHEFAHAWTADRLGDPLPRAQGRVTTNPLVHMDWVGTVILPLLGALSPILFGFSFFLLAWAKPVQISLQGVKDPRKAEYLITLAGPAMNLLICMVGVLVGALVLRLGFDVRELMLTVFIVNSLLLIFNLLPIPPLDGSHILRLSTNMSMETYSTLSSWGFPVFIILIVLTPLGQVLANLYYGCASLFMWAMLMLAG